MERQMKKDFIKYFLLTIHFELGSISSMFLRTAFTLADPERAKKTDNLTVFLPLLGSEHVKSARRLLIN
jgi:hypothetical protein